MGEFLIGPEGKVLAVWPIRQLQFRPPFPAFNQAIVDSIKQTLYEPLNIDGQRVPVCAMSAADASNAKGGTRSIRLERRAFMAGLSVKRDV